MVVSLLCAAFKTSEHCIPDRWPCHSVSIPDSNAPLGQRCIMVGIVTVGALLVHGWQNVGSWLA